MISKIIKVIYIYGWNYWSTAAGERVKTDSILIRDDIDTWFDGEQWWYIMEDSSLIDENVPIVEGPTLEYMEPIRYCVNKSEYNEQFRQNDIQLQYPGITDYVDASGEMLSFKEKLIRDMIVDNQAFILNQEMLFQESINNFEHEYGTTIITVVKFLISIGIC